MSTRVELPMTFASALFEQAEKFLRALHVECDLRTKLIRRCEFFLIAQAVEDVQACCRSLFRYAVLENECLDRQLCSPNVGRTPMLVTAFMNGPSSSDIRVTYTPTLGINSFS